MGIIGDIYKIGKDLSKEVNNEKRIRVALEQEILLNIDLMRDVNNPKNQIGIIRNLRNNEIKDVANCSISLSFISKQKTSAKFLGNINAKYWENKDLKEIIQILYRKIEKCSAEKDFEGINLGIRLKNISKLLEIANLFFKKK